MKFNAGQFERTDSDSFRRSPKTFSFATYSNAYSALGFYSNGLYKFIFTILLILLDALLLGSKGRYGSCVGGR